MRSRGLTIVVSAPSGAGKGTVLEHLWELAAAEGLRIEVPVSATTRPPRHGEGEGLQVKRYIHLDEREFNALEAAGCFIETNGFAGNRYATRRSELRRRIPAGSIRLLEIDVNGSRAIKDWDPDILRVVIVPPGNGVSAQLETLGRWLISRGTESPEEIEQRLAVAEVELAAAGEADYVLVNQEGEARRTAFELLSLIQAVLPEYRTCSRC